MSRRKLKVVDYDRDYVNLEDDCDIRRFIATMEEMHIGIRDENWSANIMDEKNIEKWKEEINQYVKDVGTPEGCSKSTAIDYVLNAAIDNIYNKNEIAKTLTMDSLKSKSREILEAHRDSQNPLNRIDYNSSEFAENARALCSLLGIVNNHSDPKILMKTACLYIVENLNENCLAEESEAQNHKMLNIKEFPLGIAPSKIGQVNFSARILRLISIHQLKEIQKKINETLVEIQNVTIDMTKQANVGQVKYGTS